jgi:hypothetical protein
MSFNPTGETTEIGKAGGSVIQDQDPLNFLAQGNDLLSQFGVLGAGIDAGLAQNSHNDQSATNNQLGKAGSVADVKLNSIYNINIS